MAQILAPHTSAIGLTEFISDVIDLRGYTVFQPNIAVSEAQETEALATQAQEDNLMASQNSEEEAMMEQAMMGAQADAQ
jgi:hypothetical protein